MIEITFIVPVYNEVITIRKIIDKILKLNIKKQLIIVDDASKDGTRDKLKFYMKKKNIKIIFHKKNIGKGGAIKSAQKLIKGKYSIIQDADLEYNPYDAIKLLNKMKKFNHDVVYGSRVLKKNLYQHTKNFTHLIRILGNIFLTKFSNLINSQNLTDAHTCYKLFKTSIFKKIKLIENDFSFCPEVTTKISNMGIKIYEYPISYKGRTYKQGKKISSFDGIKAIICLFKYKVFKI